jgi:hypothetical protein
MLFNALLATEVCWTRRKRNAFRISAARVLVASVQHEECSYTHLEHIVLPLAHYIACVASLHFLFHWVCLYIYYFLFMFAVKYSTVLLTLC